MTAGNREVLHTLSFTFAMDDLRAFHPQGVSVQRGPFVRGSETFL